MYHILADVLAWGIVGLAIILGALKLLGDTDDDLGCGCLLIGFGLTCLALYYLL